MISYSIIFAYDWNYLPLLTHSHDLVRVEQPDFDVTRQNNSGRPLLVMVATEQGSGGFHVFGNVSKEINKLKTGTVVGSSFGGNTHWQSLTFIVPPGYYYSVTRELDSAKIHFWSEVAI